MKSYTPTSVSPAFILVNETFRTYGDAELCAAAPVIDDPAGLIEVQIEVGAPLEYAPAV